MPGVLLALLVSTVGVSAVPAVTLGAVQLAQGVDAELGRSVVMLVDGALGSAPV